MKIDIENLAKRDRFSILEGTETPYTAHSTYLGVLEKEVDRFLTENESRQLTTLSGSKAVIASYETPEGSLTVKSVLDEEPSMASMEIEGPNKIVLDILTHLLETHKLKREEGFIKLIDLVNL